MKQKIYHKFKHSRMLNVSAMAVLVATAVVPMGVSAGQLENRQLQLESAAASAETEHAFTFDIATTETIEGIAFEYCENDPFPGESCDTPSGMDVGGATMTDDEGGLDTLNTEGTNELHVTGSESFDAEDSVSFTFEDVTNPDQPNEEYFVRVYTYTDSGDVDSNDDDLATDTGGIAFSTAETVQVTARVQETLQFCVYTNDECGDGGSETSLGVLNIAETQTAESYFDVATNARSGMNVQYVGSTLESDGTTIEAVDEGNGGFEAPDTGTEQFGLRIADISDGDQVAEEANDYFSNGDYALNEDDPTTIATSSGPVEETTFDIEYMGNVDALTPTGIYDTEFEYIATAQF